MIWLVLTIAAGLVAYLLVRASQGYERESAAAALEEVQRLGEVTEDLERRIRNLEAIATRVDVESDMLDQTIESPTPSERGRLRES
ncbi:MAG: hypothetical protein KJO98_03020 [Rhodothermia bacterium]|nr:hypothetical protein [Rhodothermia bacterium]